MAFLAAAQTLTKPGNVPSDAVQAIAQRVRGWILWDDQEQRKDPVRLARSLRAW